MKCGDKTGHITAKGTLCQQEIAADAPGCIWFVRTPDERSELAMKGGIASRLRRFLPASAPPPEFSSTPAIVMWAQTTAQKVLAGELDPRAAGEARQLAALTISARVADAQERLVEVALRLETGGAAMLLLSRLQTELTEGPRRPLPRARPVPMAASGDGS